ncbi:Myb-like DNA-binding domain protein [Lunasporangiospora selenospora]|uniref:Myb-like DNA-binding domain protein n=1 Tax=Lunasporangiospora selenospora TaxID=979761 RepID=A0A9P6G023_9FUNG|nr:Myb-like DNA-binding domain protein [Lunasporangiospora selenospora]
MAFVSLILKGNGARHAHANMVHASRNVNLGRCFSTCSMSLRNTTVLRKVPTLAQPTLGKPKLPLARPQSRRWSSSMAEDLGTTTNRSRKGQVTYGWTHDLDTKLVDMRLEGSTWTEIGAVLNLDAKVCHERYKRVLDPTLHQGWTPQKLEKLNSMVAAGHTWRRLSMELLMPPVTIREKWLSINPEQAEMIKFKKVLARRQARLDGGSGGELMNKSLTIRASGLVSQRRIRWSELMDSILLHLHKRELSWRQIARVFGTTPIVTYLRYAGSIRHRIAEGWKPDDLDLSNVPSYLLPDRIRQPPATEKSDLLMRQGTKTHLETPTPVLGTIANDFSYKIDETMTARNWTKEEDEAIIKGMQDETPMNKIAKSLGISENQCARRYYIDLNPKAGDWNPYNLDKLRFFVSQGLAWSSIEVLLGINGHECREKYLEMSSTLQPCQDSENGNTFTLRSAHSQQEGSPNTMQSESKTPILDPFELGDEDDMDDFEDDEDDESETGNGSNDIIDELAESYKDLDEDINPDDGNDDDDILDAEDNEENETTSDTSIGTGRRSKRKEGSSESVNPLSVLSYWDQNEALYELRRSWTSSQETTLIQHVIRNGVTQWNTISQALGGAFTPEECQAYWKYLDMPVYRGEVKDAKWKPYREAQFWRAWLEYGSNFEAITSKLNRYGAASSSRNTLKEQRLVDSISITQEDCKEIFKLRTRGLLNTYGEMEGMPKDLESLLENENFKKGCIELALLRGKRADFKWDKDMSVKLQVMVRQRLKTRDVQVNWINWRWVARHIGGGASAQRCTLHWRALRRAGMKNREEWTDDDTLQLEKGIREVGSRFNIDRVINEAEKDGKLSMQQSIDFMSNTTKGPNTTGLKMIQRFYLPNKKLQLLENKYFILSDKTTSVTLHEYMKIMEAVESYGDDQWDKVVEHLNIAATEISGRPNASSGWTKAPCRRVWQASYKHHLLYTQWTPLEDGDLKTAVNKFGGTDWISVSRFFPGKSAWQCRLRWCQITDPLNTQSSTT